MAIVTSNSTPHTAVSTSPADVAAFTGHFCIPIGVAGHATGSTDPDDGEVSAGFATQTSATISVVSQYMPDLPGLDPAPASPTTSPVSPTSPPPSPVTPAPSPPVSASGTMAGPLPSTDNVAAAVGTPAATGPSAASAASLGKGGAIRARISPRPHPSHHHRVRQPGLPHRQGLDQSSGSCVADAFLSTLEPRAARSTRVREDHPLRRLAGTRTSTAGGTPTGRSGSRFPAIAEGVLLARDEIVR
jgi:hypothetical protein